MDNTTTTSRNISIPEDEIAAFCRRHHIRKLSLFGSMLRDDFSPESDVDVLVEFEAGHVPGFITLAGMEIELSEILGRKADMRTPAELSRYFRQQVLDMAEVQYLQVWSAATKDLPPLIAQLEQIIPPEGET